MRMKPVRSPAAAPPKSNIMKANNDNGNNNDRQNNMHQEPARRHMGARQLTLMHHCKMQRILVHHWKV